MCLNTVDKETKQVTEGWKVFEVVNNELHSVYFNFKFKTNEWIKDTETRPISMWFNNKSYPTGFHFYLDKEEAETNLKTFIFPSCSIILPIKIRNVVATGFQEGYKVGVVATGFQEGYKVGVAREIFIEEESCV